MASRKCRPYPPATVSVTASRLRRLALLFALA
jgi:hypothetical protein